MSQHDALQRIERYRIEDSIDEFDSLTDERKWRNEQFGYFLNDGRYSLPIGYSMQRYGVVKKNFWRAGVVQYHFELIEANPLTYVLGKRPAEFMGFPIGTKLEPHKKFDSDWGSVEIAENLYRHDRFIAWIFHDGSYEYGTIWVKEPDAPMFHEITVSQHQADMLYCYYGIGAEDGNALDRKTIYTVVHIGGKFIWNPEKKQKLRDLKKEMPK